MSVKQGRNGANRRSNGLSRRDVLILGAGAVAVSSAAFTAIAQAAGEATHHGLSAFGDLGYPADFKHLKYVNAAAPKGGTFSQLAGGGTATFNSFNGFILKGDPAVDMEQVFCLADVARHRRARRGLCLRRRPGHRFRRRPRLQIPAAQRHQVPRRQPDHGRRRRLLADDPEDEGPSHHRQCCCATWKPPRPTATASWWCALQPTARAARRSPPPTCRSCRRPIIRARPFDETSMEPPLGSGPYKVGKFEQGRFMEFERVKDWWGAEPADHSRPAQLRCAALRLFPRPRHRVRRLHRQGLHVPRGVHLARLGNALRLPGGQGRPRQARDHPRRAALRHAGLDDQHAARAIPGRPRARGASPMRSISNGRTRT